MAFDSEAKQKMLNLVAHIEKLASEHNAMRAILSTMQLPGYPKPGIPGWEQVMKEVVNSPESLEAMHKEFEPLYRAVAEAMDDHAMLSILLTIPRSHSDKPN